MTKRVYHSIIGLPSSGKTTYLAALWHLLESDEVSTQLILDRLDGDREHLNTIAECWRKCETVPRTSGAGDTDVSIWVHEPLTGRRAKLGFPDLAGELFNQQVASRKCRKAYVEGFDGDGGVMLFLSADRRQDGIPLTDMQDLLDGPEVTDENPQPENPSDWTHDNIPEQVKLVELLQFLHRPPFQRKQRRLAVIISAWDVITKQSISLLPKDWLSRELPLFHQFIVNNSDSFEFRVYGISAQGGSIEENSKEIDELLEKIPSQRIICVGDDVKPHDITAPIHWLMSEK